VSICRSKGPQSDFGVPFLLRSPRPGVRGALPPALLLFIIIPPVMDLGRDAEEMKDNAKSVCVQQNVTNERMGVI